ncbi:Tetratricopeptide repeat protein 37 [Histomonas meleagridis]|uniref:Tetratricopeptide repeat protein 37 n=1 Tax=Histomonas meleagridis TaxID=135588 RepID=UPI0035599BF6|nr:Tetratricopeptide repeat protein 37 [Histomonas meleagridis]KAH0800703.1 Tetratricopeptide repeat protein 37 [Histomonas meleagridis]
MNNKKTIDFGLKKASELIRAQKLSEAENEVAKIIPLAIKSHYHDYDALFLRTGIAFKAQKHKETIQYSQDALVLKPGEPNLWKFLILSHQALNEKDKILTTIPNLLKSATPAQVLAELIAPYLEDLKEEVVIQFIKYLKQIPNYSKINIGKYFPDIKETIDIRIELFTEVADTDPESCSSLIELYLYDLNDIDKAIYYSEKLPTDYPTRYEIETLFGPNPIESARKLCSTGNSKFKSFLDVLQTKDLRRISNQIGYISKFYSGWIYYSTLVPTPKEKESALENALSIRPNSTEVIFQIIKLKEETKQIESAIQFSRKLKTIDPKYSNLCIELCNKYQRYDLLAKDELTPYAKAFIDINKYHETKDKNLLKDIINLPNEKQYVSLKCEALWELRHDFYKEFESKIIELMKIDRENGYTYYYFGKYKLENDDKEKSDFLFQKAFNYGIEKPETLEYITRKYIIDNDLENAIKYCKKIDEFWAHFRLGLIYQRLNKHVNACEELQNASRINPNNEFVWKALGHSNILLNRWMTVHSIAQYLRSISKPDIELEYQLNLFLDKPIEVDDLNIDKTPLNCISYIQQVIKRIQILNTYNRNESSTLLIMKSLPYLELLYNKWNNLLSVLKVCGDFYLESFRITNDKNYIKKAIDIYKIRASKDIRAESFIDVAHAMYLNDNIDATILILKKVLHRFPEHSGLWLNLGISYALTNNYSFARHCFCVAAKISSNNDKSKAFIYCIPISEAVNDQMLKEKAIQAAQQLNPHNSKILQLMANDKLMKKVDAYLLAFENQPTKEIASKLCCLLLRKNRSLEALGFAFISNDNELISASYEALNKYELALKYTNNEENKNRLKSLLDNANNNFEVFKLYSSKNLEKIIELYKDSNDVYMKFAVGICYIQLKQTENAVQIFNEIKEKEPLLTKHIDKIFIRAFPKFIPESVNTDPQMLFAIEKRKKKNVVQSAKATLKKFANSQFAIKNFVLGGIKQEKCSPDFCTELLQHAKELFKMSPSYENISLLMAAQVKAGELKEAIKTVQRMCLMRKSEIPKLTKMIQKLKENINMET